MNKKEKLKMWESIGGRKEIAELIKKLMQEVSGLSYKGIIQNAGKIRLLAEICEVDDYWGEKMFVGYHDLLNEIESKLKVKKEI